MYPGVCETQVRAILEYYFVSIFITQWILFLALPYGGSLILKGLPRKLGIFFAALYFLWIGTATHLLI